MASCEPRLFSEVAAPSASGGLKRRELRTPFPVYFQHSSWIPVAFARAIFLLQIQRPLDPSRTPSAS